MNTIRKKKNTKLIILFLLSYVVIFPVILAFAEKKIDGYNKREIFDGYKIAITLKYDALFNKFNLINEHVKKLNKNYFYFTEENINVYRPHNFEFNLNRNQVNDNFSIVFGENDIYFQIPFLAMKKIINLEAEVKNLKSQNSKFCKNIFKIDTVSEVSIDNYNLSIVTKLSQRRSNSDEKNISQNFKRCFESVVDKKIKILINYLENYYGMSSSENTLLLQRFIDTSSGIYFDSNNSEIVMKKIEEIPQLLFQDLEKNFFKLRYTGPYDIRVVEAYKREFNIYFVSAILALLLNILFFYSLFFLKSKVAFLNKIF